MYTHEPFSSSIHVFVKLTADFYYASIVCICTYPLTPCVFFFKCILSLETYLNSNYDDLAKKRAIPGRIFLIAIYIPTVPSAERHGRNAAQQPL